ncbi:hypothetical protein Tco_1275078 [Tanacetum coccineum]
MQTQEDHSHPIPSLNVDSLKVDLVVIQNTCSEKEDNNSETASSKLVKECSLNSETKDVHAIKYKMSKAKERCMAYFRSLHSHLQVLSKADLKGTHVEHGFRREFMSIFGQDVDTFTRTMLLNVDQLQKQLDKDEFQEDGSMTAFWVVNNQFQKFINSKFTLDYDSQMTDTYFVEYTRLGCNNQTSRSLPVSKSSSVTITAMPKADHSKSSSSFSDSKQLVCSTCHKCVFNANHDAYLTKLLKEVNSCAKIQSHETRNSKKPVDQKSHTQKPGRQIFTVHRFSPNKTSAVYEKTSPRSNLRWKPTGRIFKSVGLRWIPTGKLFDSCTSKVDSEPPHGSNVDIPHIHECKQTLDVSAGTSINVQKEQSLDLSAVSTEVHQAAETVTTSNELDLLFGPLFDEYFNRENQVVLKSSAVTTTDASNKRQQQPDSTSSTSTLATTVTANGNFDLESLSVVSSPLLFQGNTTDELPERLIGAVRVSHLELSSAIVPKLESDA